MYLGIGLCVVSCVCGARTYGVDGVLWRPNLPTLATIYYYYTHRLNANDSSHSNSCLHAKIIHNKWIGGILSSVHQFMNINVCQRKWQVRECVCVCVCTTLFMHAAYVTRLQRTVVSSLRFCGLCTLPNVFLTLYFVFLTNPSNDQKQNYILSVAIDVGRINMYAFVLCVCERVRLCAGYTFPWSNHHHTECQHINAHNTPLQAENNGVQANFRATKLFNGKIMAYLINRIARHNWLWVNECF